MARIVAFDQDQDSPSGTGMFHFDNGQSVFAHDPDTASRFGPDQRTAELDPNMSAAADQNASYQPPMATDAGGPVRQGVTTVEPAMAQSETGQPSPVGPTQPQQPASPYVSQEAAAQQYIMRPVRVAASKGGFKPKTASETVETEHMPYSEEEAQQRRQLNEDVEAAHLANFGAQAQRAQAEQEYYRGQMPVLQAKAAKAQAEYDAIGEKYKQERAGLQNLINNFDPKKVYHDAGTGGTIALAIAQGLGAFGAGLSGGPNYAKQVVDDAVNRSIAAQKDQQGSALKNLEMTLGDRTQAEAALRVASDHYVANQVQAFAATAKSEDAANAANMWLTEHAAQTAKDEQAFKDAAYGKHVRKVESAYAAPSAGGKRAPTDQEMQLRARTLEAMNNVVKGQAETDKLRAEAAGGGKETREDAKDLVKTEKDYVKAQAEMQGVRDIVQKYKDQDSIPGFGYAADAGNKVLGPRMGLTAEGRLNRGKIDRAIGAMMVARYGTSPERNPEMYEKLQQRFYGAKTTAELEGVVNEMDEEIKNQRNSIRAGYSPQVVQTVDQRGAYQPTEIPQSARRVGQ